MIGLPEPPNLDQVSGPPLATATPVALSGGERFQFTYAVDLLAATCAMAAGPRPPGGP